jgi:signal transduction histidine kinase
MRHTPAGGKIDVWATEVSAAHRDASSRGFLVVSIRNPGTFIPSGEQDQLLEYLDPLDAGHAAGSAGALAVSKGLVAAHGGWISVASEPGQGSTLSFSIPAAGAA